MEFDPLPAQCLVDQALAIRVRGAPADVPVTLKLCSRFNDLILLSTASFLANADGVIDVTTQAPFSGSYQGIDAMGLFWSRAPVTDDATFAAPSSDPLTATLTAESSNGEMLISHAIRRVYVAGGVTSRTVRERGLVGTMFEPAAAGPRPAVLVVGGSGGGTAWSLQMAALLASHGYPALALAYFAAEGLPATLDCIPLEYFGTALEWLAEQPTVNPERIAVSGVSRGGELALLLGATFPAIRAVIAYVPSGILWDAYPTSGHAAWTLNGNELPHAQTLTYAEWDAALADGTARPGSFDWYLIPLRDEDYAAKMSIPVENINGPVLMISGVDDALWPSTELTEFAVQRFKQKSFPHDVQHLCYPGAGHSIAWPNGPTTMLKSKHPVSGEDMDMGGTPEGTARASQDSWPLMLAFLRDALANG